MKQFKKLLAIITTIAIFAVMVSGCSEPVSATEESKSVDVEETITTSEVEPDVVESTCVEEKIDIDLSETDVDVSNARASTSKDNPAKLGEWVKSAKYNPTSGKQEPIYWRVINTSSNCQGKIEEYNAGDNFYKFEPLENEDLGYCIVTYQVYFPEEYPAAEWGISSPDIMLTARNPEGGGINFKGVSYIGLGSCKDISKDTIAFPGKVFTGESVYAMINDPSVNYVFEYSHNVDGDDGIVYDYVASK